MPVMALVGFGFLVGVYSALFGIGGGILLVPLMIALGADIKTASATALVIIIPTALSGVLWEWSYHRVDWALAILLAVGAMVGSFGGVAVKNALASLTLRRGFATLLVLVALDMMQFQVGDTPLTLRSLLRHLLSR